MQKTAGLLSTTPELCWFMASSLCLELELLQAMLVAGRRLLALSLADSSLLQGEVPDVPKPPVFSIAAQNVDRHHREENPHSV